MMNMSKVKCRSCQSEYDENEYSRCPKCGSEEKVTFEELYKKREKEQREKEKYEEEEVS